MDPVLDFTLRGALVLLFLSAAAHKLRAPAGFCATLANYRLLPERATAAAAAAVVAAELATGTALLARPFRTPAASGAIVLLSAYSLSIAVNLARGRRDIDCGCSAPALRQTISAWLLARNAALVVIAAACLFPVRARGLVWVDQLSILGGVAVLAALYGSANRMLAYGPLLGRLRGSG